MDIVCCRECAEPLRGDACPKGHSQDEPKPPAGPSFWEQAAERLFAPETGEAASELLSIACPSQDDVGAFFVSEEARASTLQRAMSPEGRAAQKQLLRALLGRATKEEK